MKIIESEYIVEAVGCHIGQKAFLAKIESAEDSRELLDNIISSNYYNTEYFKDKTGMKGDLLALNLWFIASMIRKLQPSRVLEVGAGKGDVLQILNRLGTDAYGIDFSIDMYKQLAADIRDKYWFGDFGEVCQQLGDSGQCFDTLVGLDIWEHVLPEQVETYLSQSLTVLSEDGLVFAVIPAFGEDKVFGQPFPLEFAENRTAFHSHQPFPYLTLEQTDPPIPSCGHLIWADSTYWQNLFESKGLIREPLLEKRLHAIFDQFIPHSNRSFFLFRRDTLSAQQRTTRILQSWRLRFASLEKLRNIAGLYYGTYFSAKYRWAGSPLAYTGERLPLLETLINAKRRLKSPT